MGYQGPPGLYPVGEALWIDGRPVFPTGGYAPSGQSPSDLANPSIANGLALNGQRPLFFVVGLGNRTRYEEAVATVKAHFDAPVRFVLPSQLIRLQREAWRGGLARTTLLGLPVSTNIDAYFLTEGDGHSLPARSAATVSWFRPAMSPMAAPGHTSSMLSGVVTSCRSQLLAAEASRRAGTVVSGRRSRRSDSAGGDGRGGAKRRRRASGLYVWVKFTAKAGARLAVTSLQLTYNAEPRRIRLRKVALTSAAPWSLPRARTSLRELSRRCQPMSPRTWQTAGVISLRFQAPPGRVTLTGFGGSTWVAWPVPVTYPGALYSSGLGA